MGETVGVILAGGTGTRLMPLTVTLNKHLCAVGSLPMLEYPLHVLLSLGIKKVIVVAGGEHIGSFMQYLASGAKYGCDVIFKAQDGATGIADALRRARGSVSADDRLVVILGDNLFDTTDGAISRAIASAPLRNMGLIFLKRVPDPERFGVAVLKDGELVDIVEKPKPPAPSDLAVTGLYVYDGYALNLLDRLKPSARGELEITDFNKMLLQKGVLSSVELSGYWSDMGTHKSRSDVQAWLREHPDFEQRVMAQRAA